MPLDYLASEPHYVHHLGPLWAAGDREGTCWHHGEGARAAWAAHGANPVPWQGHAGALVVASGQDYARARRSDAPRIAFIEHGAGQSYAGDPQMARHSAYAGGDGRDRASLALVPNEMSAARWQERYPSLAVVVIGATRVLSPPKDPCAPLLAIGFHWSSGSREHMGALPHYRRSLPDIAGSLPVIVTAHPRVAATIQRICDRYAIEFVADIEAVARRATVYAVDNSSTLWEMAVQRPVIAMNAPWFRRAVHHGLRFWSHIPGPQVDDGAALMATARRLMDAGETDAEWRRRMLTVAEVLPRFDGAARGATLLASWAAAG